MAGGRSGERPSSHRDLQEKYMYVAQNCRDVKKDPA